LVLTSSSPLTRAVTGDPNASDITELTQNGDGGVIQYYMMFSGVHIMIFIDEYTTRCGGDIGSSQFVMQRSVLQTSSKRKLPLRA
jgi:hypothetical protein